MRLIDADALLEKLKKTDRYFVVKYDIEQAPTIDLPHGEWVENKKYNRRGKKFLNCSVCNYGKDGDICCEVSSTPNFCPNCGARMVIKNDK